MAETILTYELNITDTYTVKSCTSVADNGIVIIPKEYNGKRITKIDNEVFKDKTNIKCVIIGSGVEFGTNVFGGCPASTKLFLIDEGNNKTVALGGGTKVFYYYPDMPYNDMDFLGFTFNGKHSYLDLGVIRIINDRIQTQLSPDISDLTAESTGSDGMYFFGSYHKSRKFTVDFAFDNLTET